MRVIAVVIGPLGIVSKNLGIGLWKLGDQRKTRDRPDYSIVEIDQNTVKNPGHLRRLGVTLSSMNYHQLIPV